ncbi:MAG: hypothetical protein AB7O52_08840 [Planctomycetota bacterium]
MARAKEAAEQRWLQVASVEEVEAARHVVDHDADSVTCPACGTRSPAGTERCPDCELRIG